jgi:hypothetical protein
MEKMSIDIYQNAQYQNFHKNTDNPAAATKGTCKIQQEKLDNGVHIYLRLVW